jgi:hypothetical protein
MDEAAMACPVRPLERQLEMAAVLRHLYQKVECRGVRASCHDGRERERTARCC